MEAQESTIETGDHPEGSLGQIKVNHTVVSTIVKMAAINVSGVLAVGVAVPIVGQVRTHVHLCARAHICDVHMYGCVCLCESSE